MIRDGSFCLGIEAATPVVSVALRAGGRSWLHEETGAKPSRAVFAWITALLAEARVELADLHFVAIGVGPGSFTGLRVAAAAAQSFGFVTSMPVVRVSTLAVLAMGAARQSGGGPIAVALDAQRGQVYRGVYRRDGEQWINESPDGLYDAADAAANLPAGAVLAGDGWRLVDSVAEAPPAISSARLFDLNPSAADLLDLAGESFRRGEYVTAFDAIPNYVRENVAGSR